MIPQPDSLLGVLFERLVLNLDLVELIIQIPNLTVDQIAGAFALMTAWKFVCDQLDRLFFIHLRRWLVAMGSKLY